MKIAGLTLMLLLLLACPSKATEVGMKSEILKKTGFEKIVDFADSIGTIDIMPIFECILSGDWQLSESDILRIAEDIKKQIISVVSGDASRLAVPVFMSIFAKILLNRGSGTLMGVQLFFRIASVGIMAEIYVGVHETAVALLQDILDVSGVITPVMISALSLTGATTTASMLSPLASLGALGISCLMEDVGLKLVGAGAVIAITGNLSDSFRLKRLFKLIKSTIIWMTGILMAGFTGILSIQGLMGNSMDSAAVRGMQYTAESLIPIIGGDVSDSMDSLITSTVLIKNAIGITGLAVLISCCAAPLIKLVAFSVSMKLCAAIMEPAADGCIVDTAAQFGDIAEMLLVICLGSMLLVLLLMGASLVTAGNILG